MTMEAIQSCLPRWNNPSRRSYQGPLDKKIEDYRPGYPRFTALLSAHKPYFVFRRFDKLRARILLQKQDDLAILEERLEQIDQQESSALFLGKIRSDKNSERRAVLLDIEAGIKDYDEFSLSTSHMMGLGDAHPRDVESLHNWITSNGCLARQETKYLSSGDLFALTPMADNATVQLEAWVETLFIKFYSGFKKHTLLSDDPHVYIDNGSLVQRTSKAILLFIITIFLLMPIIICSCVNSMWMKLTTILIFTMCYLLVVSALTRSRTMELILAGATYATVLTVFVPNTVSS